MEPLAARLRGQVSPMAVLQVVAIAILTITWYRVAAHRWENDAYTYWNAWRGGLYDLPFLTHGAYDYSPAVAQLIYPWTLLSFRIAWLLESGAQIAALALIAGPVLAVVLFYVPLNLVAGYPNPVAATIENGNIEILLALAVVAAYRWPWAWAFVLHTKIVPAVGILWYPLRREWRRLAWALVPAAAIAGLSYLVAPDLWHQWIDLVRTAAGTDAASSETVVRVPLVARLLVAAALTAIGARTDRYWLVPIAATLALPDIRLGGLAVAVGAVPFLVGPSKIGWLIPGPLVRLWGATASGREGAAGA